MYRGYYRRQPVNPPTKRDLQAKLLILLLIKGVNRHMSEQITKIKNYNTLVEKSLKSISKISEHSTLIQKIQAWDKLKANVIHAKSEERLFKSTMNLVKRIQIDCKKHAFHKIQERIYLGNTSALDKMQKSKKQIMYQTLKKIAINRKQMIWIKLQNYVNYSKQKKRVLVIGMIFKSAQKRNLLQGWSKLMLECGKTMSSVVNRTQNEDLTLQIQDLKVQVENKNTNISRLQEEIEEMRQSSYRQDPGSIHYNPINSSKLNRSARSSRKRLNQSQEKDSFDGSVMRDLSFGSIFTGSVRSRGSTKKGECNCEYSAKYDKYKAAAESYKNQLQIIKAELQFTKQMNEHMQNEIKMQLGSDEKDKKLERLRIQLKQIQKDRDHLVEKVAKYEKYTAKLKSQFKMKIQQIYRKVKKGH